MRFVSMMRAIPIGKVPEGWEGIDRRLRYVILQE